MLDKAVALDPAALLGVPELGADLRAETVEEVEERRGVAAHERAREAERLAAGVGEDTGVPGEAVAAWKLLLAPPKRYEKDVVEVKVVKAPAQTEVLRTHGVAPEEEEKRRTAMLESGLIEKEWA